MWSLKDTLVKAGAIVSGVFFTLTLLSALLPWVLDRLERRARSSPSRVRPPRALAEERLSTVISVLDLAGSRVSACAQSERGQRAWGLQPVGPAAQDPREQRPHRDRHGEPGGAWSGVGRGSPRKEACARSPESSPLDRPVVSGEVMVSSPSNLAGVIVRGVDPIDHRKRDRAQEQHRGRQVRASTSKTPDKLRHLPPDEVIGLGPGGERYLKGQRSRRSARRMGTRSCGSTLRFARSSIPVAGPAPGAHHRPRARQDAARLRRRRGDARLSPRRSGPDGPHAEDQEVSHRGDLLQRDVRVRREPVVYTLNDASPRTTSTRRAR